MRIPVNKIRFKKWNDPLPTPIQPIPPPAVMGPKSPRKIIIRKNTINPLLVEKDDKRITEKLGVVDFSDDTDEIPPKDIRISFEDNIA